SDPRANAVPARRRSPKHQEDRNGPHKAPKTSPSLRWLDQPNPEQKPLKTSEPKLKKTNPPKSTGLSAV
ncbi:hypothetical protein LC092_02955, partial [Stappia stellulata]|uniref:hypothetical protein n=1 Tax=Stappia stellulata TaxID=71235 RepID=UPI001CD818FB